VIVSENSARSRYESSVVADDLGIIHLVYASRGDQSGVYYRRSPDGGESWEAPVLLSPPLRPREGAFSAVQVALSAGGAVHAAWETAEETGYGRGVYYRRSGDRGLTWDPAWSVALAEESGGFTGWPYLFASGQGSLFLVYALPENRGRGYRVSHDGGRTWTEEVKILREMEGINGFVFPLEDSTGSLHLVVNMRPTATQETGIYYSSPEADGWTRSSPVVTGKPYSTGAHYASGAIRLGNEIHIVWTDLGGGDIWHVSGLLMEAPAIDPLPEIDEPAGPTPAGQPPALSGITYPSGGAQQTFERAPAPAEGNSLAPVILSLLSALIIVIPVVVWRRIRM
jgi:hypothetical protein